MEIMMIRPVICQPMNQPWITVEVENDWLILGEKTVEIPIRKTHADAAWQARDRRDRRR